MDILIGRSKPFTTKGHEGARKQSFGFLAGGPAWLRALMVVLAALLVAAPMQLVAAQDTNPRVRITQVDNSQFPKVTVYVSVTDAAGKPVGIDPGQIQLYENGQLMKPDTVGGSGQIGTLTTLLVIDTSGSMLLGNKLQGAKDAAIAYVNQMRPGDQAGLESFNSSVKLVQPVTADHAALTAAINSLVAQNDTAMYDALSQGTQVLKDVQGRKTIIVLTDGLDNISKTTPDQVIKAIGPGGLSISTIGLGDPGKAGGNSGLDEAGLRTLADKAGGVYGYANDPASLQALYQRYAVALQSEYKLTYTSPAVLRDGTNRSLTINLGAAGAAAGAPAAQAQYNPGGVLPEVAQGIPWPIFAAILGVLLLLLVVPLVFGSVFEGLKGKGGGKGFSLGRKKSHIKLK
jgi:VWFA-related protein